MRLALRVLLSVVILTSPAAAVAEPVKYWLPLCKPLISNGQPDIKSAYRAGQCLGMIEATAFYLQAATPGGLPFRACLPENSVTSTQLVTTVLQWIEKKPNLLNEDFMVVAGLALAATWPCK